ncbi:uncharacterized protein CIMG_11083 [Coccidioides immitis RS]|uniref:Uncharacterized protein n=3 Tax=Coccidioides immitis TaxID=5501 RepID=A0A0D8JYY6_COCIM|nr:uncharacterized protein CIMG_11083 [Coccidioides immitis RS]KJF61478.1 hypothetical protein CIMG_11083 [Coccidioides immitis RS]KMP07453.1 hypothetical protein CIRG_07134 [Coccidioides immitis RMSCC 2394]KMU82533.1 hypothetical protein CIHG_00314 [Coccidioides immitis H538.4]
MTVLRASPFAKLAGNREILSIKGLDELGQTELSRHQAFSHQDHILSSRKFPSLQVSHPQSSHQSVAIAFRPPFTFYLPYLNVPHTNSSFAKMCVQWWEKFECGCTALVGNVESCSSMQGSGNQSSGTKYSGSHGNQGSGSQCPKNPGVEMRKKYTIRPGNCVKHGGSG